MEANAGKIVTDLGFPRRISRGLFHDKPFCCHVDPDAEHFGPERVSGALSCDSGSDACLLAWGSANNDVGWYPFESPDVVIYGFFRKSF